ncbi:hypothetical protein [Kiloniella sp.]|uniref:hypothetical protein n=1 Tax=Kiloniella sp. TaxID=1938587 RepID=UPI003B02C1B8
MMTEGSKALLFALDAVSAMDTEARVRSISIAKSEASSRPGLGTAASAVDLDRLAKNIEKSEKLRRCGTEDLWENLGEDGDLELA